MKSKETKSKIDNLFKTISECQLEIVEIQNGCKHENTFEGNYSWRVGVIEKKEMCADCLALIPENYNSHLYYSEVIYSSICPQCIDKSCNCTFGKTIVKQHFPLKNNIDEIYTKSTNKD